MVVLSLRFSGNMSIHAGRQDEFPPDWADDDRMSFLFSAFKENREVNTSDWDGKIDFWTPLVISICKRRGAVCVNLNELNQIFRRKGNVPLGLGTVIQGMARYTERALYVQHECALQESCQKTRVKVLVLLWLSEHIFFCL